MKNLAILIGVADYQHINKLSPCNRDIELISNILDISEKYQEVLLLNNSPSGSTAKDQIAEFIRLHQESDIDEIFIYYTGHGTRIKEDFLYLFADFDEHKLEQTSLRNSEFDAMLKSLKPKLTVKVIDACQAGTEYIKSNQELQMIFDKSSKESFNKAYFLFSSSSAESSVALRDFSVFTKSFAKSLLGFENQNVRYRDIMAYISDDATVRRHQTPLFVQQADNTEVFINVSEKIIVFLTNKFEMLEESDDLKDIESNESESPLHEIATLSSLVNKVKNKGESFCSEDEAIESINQLKIFLNDYTWVDDLSKYLFDIELEFNSIPPYLDSRIEIAEWLSETDEEYFTNLQFESESYETEVPHTNFYMMVAGQGGFKTVTKYRDVLKSYKVTAPCPFQTLIITLVPKEQILSWYKVFITLIFSKSKLTIFYKFEREKEKNWCERFIDEQNEWKTVHCALKQIDQIKESVEKLMKDIEDQIISDIQKLVD